MALRSNIFVETQERRRKVALELFKVVVGAVPPHPQGIHVGILRVGDTHPNVQALGDRSAGSRRVKARMKRVGGRIDGQKRDEHQASDLRS